MLKDTQLLKKQRDKAENERRELFNLLHKEQSKVQELQSNLQKIIRNGVVPSEDTRTKFFRDDAIPGQNRDDRRGDYRIPFSDEPGRSNVPIQGSSNNQDQGPLPPLNLDPNSPLTFEEFCKRWDKAEHEDPIKAVLLNKVIDVLIVNIF